MRLRSRPTPKDTKLKRLAKVPLFGACSKRDLERIASLADEIDVPAGRVLIRQGDPGRECFVIMSGKAKVSIRGKRTRMLGPGDCFGELALLDRAPRSATVTAESDSHLLVLGSRDFSALIDSVPAVGRKVLAAIAERLREAERAQPHH
ncbi:MAG: cyclic nucleotide-binding domain-containing protein [Solirubrobacterales bacterium]